jgi:hypothetical protein
MKTPLIDALLADVANQRKSKSLDRYLKAIQTIELGIAEKKIWNTDLSDAKYVLGSVGEMALDIASEPWKRNWNDNRGDTGHWPAGWTPDDVRQAIIYHPQFSNTPGAAKRLTKFEGKDHLYDQFIAVLKEVATLAELVKAAKPFIVKGRKPNPDAPVADLSNTGICGVCMRRQKLRFNATLVDHGYELAYGSRNGVCLGARYKAWELSPEGGEFFLQVLKENLEYSQKYLSELDTVTSISYMARVKVKEVRGITTWRDERREMESTDPAFPTLLQRTKTNTENRINNLTADIEAVSKRLGEWQKQPLMYGGAETQERWKSKLLNGKR